MQTSRFSSILGVLIGVAFSTAIHGQVPSQGAQVQGAQRALDRAVRGTPAVAVVLDARTGRAIAMVRLSDGVRAAPGSVLKPLFLTQALRSLLIHPQETVMCRRRLHIAGRDLDCTHPQGENVFDAEQSLAYSCNSYFAEMAKRFTPEIAVSMLSDYGAASSIARRPAGVEQIQLFVLGLDGVSITPIQLAEAYRRLAEELADAPPDSPMQAVERGLEDSVAYGMAHNAYVDGLSIAGKTGTASNTEQAWTHGWFVGFAPAKLPKVIIVVYLPRGNGADAAHIAQSFLSEYKGALVR